MIAKADQYPLKAIRAHCLDCAAGNTANVRFCPCHGTGEASKCALWPFRFGVKPNSASLRKRLGEDADYLLSPDRMPPADLPLEKCEAWIREQQRRETPGAESHRVASIEHVHT